MNMEGLIDTREKLLNKKQDYSPFLVHLTSDSYEYDSHNEKFTIYAKDVLDSILDEKILRAYNYFFPYSPALESQSNSVKNKFRVVCFTETPIGQIDILLNNKIPRKFNPKPYGLIFTKDYISNNNGNPVFYTTLDIAKPLWTYLYQPYIEGKEQVPDNICRLLALVTECQPGNDFHWEREWRIVGDLNFKTTENIYCGICPEEDIDFFQNKYHFIFISPYWGINKILDTLVNIQKHLF